MPMSFEGYMLPAFLFSTFGAGLFLYGKKAPNLPAGVAGIAMILEPCVIFSPWLLWTVGAVTCAAWIVVSFARRGLESA